MTRSICKVGNIFHLASVLALIEVFILICLIIARFVTKGFDDNATKVILLAVAIIVILIIEFIGVECKHFGVVVTRYVYMYIYNMACEM